MRRTFVLGMLSGGLIAFGLSILAWYVLFQVFLHHMFIIGSSPVALGIGALPVMLAAAGTIVAIRVTARQGASS